MTEDSRYIEKIPNRSMTHTDTDIAEILERFDKRLLVRLIEIALAAQRKPNDLPIPQILKEMEDFIARECLALKKKWEREHFDNQDERG